VTTDQLRWRRGLVVIVVAAVLIRIPALFMGTMWHDEAVEGLMSQDVLRGRFPIFFYGQPAHGVADRYVAAFAILAGGPTPVALTLGVLPLSFVFLGSVAYATRRVFGPRVALVATLFLAIPPYYFFGWNFDSRGHYMLMLVLGTWLSFLTWKILGEGVSRSPRRRFVGLGLMAGLAWWTNYLSITFLLPIALALVVKAVRATPRGWRPLLERAAIALTAFAVGTVPLVAYYAAHRLAPFPPGRVAGEEDIESHVVGLTTAALPQILGVHPAIWQSARRPVYVVVAALTLAAVLYSVGWWWRTRRSRGTEGGTVGVLAGVVTMTLVVSVVTRYGDILRYPRYLLPLYLALPVFLGIAADHVGRRAPVVTWTLVGAIALNNLLGSLALTPVLASAETVARHHRWSAVTRDQLEALEQHELRSVYGTANHWSFLSDRSVVVSDPYQERMTEVVRAVDAAERVSWVFGSRDQAFEQSAHAAGIRFRRLEGHRAVAYTDFDLAGPAHVELDPGAWSATASHEAEPAAHAYDRIVDSRWRTGVAQAPGQFFQVDLGRPSPIGLVTWLPWGFQETPAGFAVAVSSDALTWQEVARVPQYVGPLYWSGTHPFQRIRRSRVEVRFPPVQARHVKIELTATTPRTWSIRELMVGTPATECPQRHDPVALVGVLRSAGVTVAYADHWASAVVAKLSGGEIRTLPSNKSVNSYRLERPHWDEIEALRFRQARQAIVVEDCPPQRADAVAALLDDTGVRFRRQSLAGFTVFTGLLPAAYQGAAVPWRVAGSADRALVIDAGPAERAASLVLVCQRSTGPIAAAQLELETSEDGRRFAARPFRLRQPGRLRMSGSWLFRDPPSRLVLEFEPHRLAAARITDRAGTWERCAVGGVLAGRAA